MAFGDFSFPQVQTAFQLTQQEADMFGSVPELSLRPEFVRALMDDANLAVALNTEKARSEFVIAPVLLEVRRLMGASFGLFSGVDLNVDPGRGLNGVCDFLITKSPHRYVMTSPILTIFEAKNDNIRSGLGQCISAMVAAQAFNLNQGSLAMTIYGCVSTGSNWLFLKLEASAVTFDMREHQIANVAKIMAIIKTIVDSF